MITSRAPITGDDGTIHIRMCGLLALVLAGPVLQEPPGIADLIRDVASEDLDAREKATDRLMAMGAAAVSALRKAAAAGDDEHRARYRWILAMIEARRILPPAVLKAEPDVDREVADGGWSPVLDRWLQDRGRPADALPRKDVTTMIRSLLGADVGADVKIKVSALSSAIGLRAAAPELRSMLKSGEAALRKAAATALIELKMSVARGEVSMLLADPDAGVRAWTRRQYETVWFRGIEHWQGHAELLKDADPAVRERAVRDLHRLAAREAGPRLIPLLDDAKASIRLNAALALGALACKEAAARLRKVLQDPDPLVRGAAAQALGLIGDADAAADLRLRLDDSDAAAGSAAYALGAIGAKEATGDLLRALAKPHAKLRVQAAAALAMLDAHEARTELEKLLSDPRRDVRCAAIAALGTLEEGASAPTLVPYLTDGDEAIREAADVALQQIGVKRVVADLAGALAKADAGPRARIARLLGGAEAGTAAPLLVRLATDADAFVRAWALDSLARLGARDRWKEIAAGLSDPVENVRATAAGALAKLGAREAWPDLVKSLETPWEGRTDHVGVALVLLDADEAWADLAKLATNPKASETARARALDTLFDLKAEASAGQAVAWLSDPNPTLRRAGALILGAVGDSKYATDVARRLTDDSPAVRHDAVAALGALEAKETAPEIVKRLKDDVAEVRKAAADILPYLEVADTWRDLVPLLQDPDTTVRHAAIYALGRSRAAEAAPELCRIVETGAGEDRTQAIIALSHLRRAETAAMLLPLLDDARVREWAALAVASLGRREAVPALLEMAEAGDFDHAALQAMNEIAFHGRYASYLSLRLGVRTDRLTLDKAAETIRASCGVSIQIDPAVPAETRQAYVSCGVGPREKLARALHYMTTSIPGVVWRVDGEGVLILPRAAALAYWRNWTEKNP